MIAQDDFTLDTPGRGMIELTTRLSDQLARWKVGDGLLHVFVHHTSASLIITENADPSVRRDLETFIAGLVHDGDPRFRHDAEGPDDMAAHVRAVLTQAALSVPVRAGRLALGTWQGVYLWEHRTAPQRRRLTVTLL